MLTCLQMKLRQRLQGNIHLVPNGVFWCYYLQSAETSELEKMQKNGFSTVLLLWDVENSILKVQ